VPITRRSFITQATAISGVALAQEKRPNIILLITDDQGYGDLSLHGNPYLSTPNLDRIGQEGVQCTRFHVSPVCSPTRSSLMTGRYNYRTGVVDTFNGRSLMYPDETTLPEILSRAGYSTGIFGKWHLGDNYPLRSIDQGFAQSVVHHGGGLGQPSDPPGNTYFDPILYRNGKPERFRGYCTDIFTRTALDFIEQNRARPFFTYLATNAPHSPYQIDDKYVEPFRGKGLDDVTTKVYGMVANIDENAGLLLKKLEELGIADNTIVIYMTDNGPQSSRFNAGMRGTKGTVYEGGIRVPFFVRWPARLKAGRTADGLAAHIDVLPTLLEASGIGIPKDLKLDGKSMLPLLESETAPWADRTICLQWHRGDEPEPFNNSAVLTDRYKLVKGAELYDIKSDPAEKNDIAREHPNIVTDLRKRYEGWFRDVSSTRGYAPPRIHLGTDHENPLTLTRQDWRGSKNNWDIEGMGYWEVDVARGGRYEIVVHTVQAESAGKAQLRLGQGAWTADIPPGESKARFVSVPLRKGAGRLEVEIDVNGRKLGASYVDVKRL
jgi:arylsulfatase A-like enzyme